MRRIRLGLLLLALVTAGLLGSRTQAVHATPEGSITYTVYQTPVRGSLLQVGDTLTFRVDVTSAPSAFTGPVVFDVKKPLNMSFLSFGTQAGNILTSCQDNTPLGGYLRCTVGGGVSMPAGALESGTSDEIVLRFMVDPGAAGTQYDDGTIQGLFNDTGAGFRNSGDTPDNTIMGDGYDASVGYITVPNILGTNTNIVASTVASPASIFEGGLSTLTVTFTHSLGAVGPTLQPIDVTVTNADVQAGSLVCPNGTGTPQPGASTARCIGSTVTTGSTMSFNVRGRDTAGGDDAIVTLSAPSLGLTVGEASVSPVGTALQVIGINELGLETVTLPAPGSATPPWAVGSPIAVCTATVAGDATDDRAAGAGQTPGLVAGTATLVPVTPLAVSDFTVTGPGGPVAMTYLDGGPSACGANQSGVQFTPAISGAYQVTAAYNGDTTSAPIHTSTRGTNTLSIGVQTVNPAPSISSLSPSSAGAGGPTFTLTVNGGGFVPSSVVRWNGLDRGTSFVSSSQLQATVSSADIASTGSANVTVFNPSPGGGSSGASTFSITGTPNGAPLISGLTPASAGAGSPGFTITVNGSNFVNGSVVRWNGSDRATTFINGTQVTANVFAGDLISAGTANVSVFNPAPGGGTSPASLFTISSAPNPVPSVTSLSPASGVVGGAAFSLAVNGANFTPASTVRWNGSDRATTFVSSSQISAAITVSDLSALGTQAVSVFTAAPGGGTSSALSFAVNNPAPNVTSLGPNAGIAGGDGLTLTVSGTGFVSTSMVRWNGTDRATTYVSPTQLTATILASDIATAGTASVSVVNGAPGGGTSNSATFTINNPAPGTASLTPGSATAGDPALSLMVNGTGFTAQSSVRWNGSDRPTVYVSATQVTASISASDLADGATANVTVFTPSPGGGASSPPLTFTVTSPLPSVTTLSPDQAAAGGSAFVLTVTGTGFTASSKVRWNGTDKTTSYVSPTQITASIDQGDITALGTVTVSVSNGAPGGGISGNLVFTVVPGTAVPSDQLVLTSPAGGSIVGRSRLVFTATRGSLAVPSSVSFVIRRMSDGRYWNSVTSTWGDAVFENPGAADASGTWSFSLTGAGRRLFAGLTITVETRAFVGTTPYIGSAVPQIQVR